MSAVDRAKFAIYLAEEPSFLEAICRAVSTSEQDAAATFESHDHDCWWSDSVKTRFRLALLPLLPDAVADELRRAVATAEKYAAAHDLLHSLALLRQLTREASSPDDCDLRVIRRNQTASKWLDVDAMFPEYAEKPVEASA